MKAKSKVVQKNTTNVQNKQEDFQKRVKLANAEIESILDKYNLTLRFEYVKKVYFQEKTQNETEDKNKTT